MSVTAINPALNLAPGKVNVAKAEVVELSPRTRVLLQGPIVATLLRMAWPNVLVMFAQAATGLIETWFVAKLGTDALAGMAVVFPAVMLMQMVSAGAMGIERARSASSHASSMDLCAASTVMSCSGLGNTLNDAATMTPSVPSAP